MNQIQKVLLGLGLAAIIFLCLCPPYNWERTTYIMAMSTGAPRKAEVIIENAGHHWIWDAPGGMLRQAQEGLHQLRASSNAMLDWPRLRIYVGLIAALTLFATFIIFRK